MLLILIHIYPTVLSVFLTNASSTFVPHLASLFDLHWPACPVIRHAYALPLCARGPLTFRYLRENKIEHLPKSPLGVRVTMYRNVLCCFI